MNLTRVVESLARAPKPSTPSHLEFIETYKGFKVFRDTKTNYVHIEQPGNRSPMIFEAFGDYFKKETHRRSAEYMINKALYRVAHRFE